jgi:GMP synthase (glutamine-hydrolysing)
MPVNSTLPELAILDFGSQFTHMVSRRLRGSGVRCEIFSPSVTVEELVDLGVKGIILSGGPASVYASDAPEFNEKILHLDIPILGICYGFQLMAKLLGGEVVAHDSREYGGTQLTVTGDSLLFSGTPRTQRVWMSHGDVATDVPNGFETVAITKDCPQAAAENSQQHRYGVQFHPEVAHSEYGQQILLNFARNICGCAQDWDRQAYLSQAENYIESTVGTRSAFLLVSGGIDSVVVFLLLNRVLGPSRVKGLFVDTGLLREGESARVRQFFDDLDIDNYLAVDASQEFLTAVADLSDPEAKRTAIGELFLSVKDRVMSELALNSDDWVLAQGTIYPDIVTSGGSKNASVIKTHHNALPSLRSLEVVEPLRHLYKDEVRELAAEVGLPADFIKRHPFPGPGLAVRIAGRATREKLELYRKLDEIVLRQLHAAGWYERLWMGFPILVDVDESRSDVTDTNQKAADLDQWVLQWLEDRGMAVSEFQASILPIRSVGVKGDHRTYEHPVQMWFGEGGRRSHVSHELVEELSRAITNRTESVNRVLLTLTSKRPAELWQRIIVLRMLVSVDTLTSDWGKLDHDLLDRIASEIASAAPGIDAVLLDVTQKPPGTMEWE